MPEKNKLALALSGGGVRAMAFHAGVLLYLAENNQLEKVVEISSVSGGSLLLGLIYKENNYTWPDSKDYKDRIYNTIKTQLCTTNLQLKALFILLFYPKNWIYILSRANILAMAIEKLWGVKKKLGGLSLDPTWSINATTAENGKRFRFKHDTFGDYLIGYSNSSHFELSKAIAVSAAFPGGIGPLVIHTDKYCWKKRKKWGDPVGTEQAIKPRYKKIHIYDGGVYDNLGTEPLFDVGKGLPKNEEQTIFVSDAGSPLQKGFNLGVLNPFRIKRILDISTDQSRSLRIRSFMNYLNKNKQNGGYLMIGQHPKEILNNDELNKSTWQTENDVQKVSSYKTNLKIMSEDNFELISRHGYELAKSIDIIKNSLFSKVCNENLTQGI